MRNKLSFPLESLSPYRIHLSSRVYSIANVTLDTLLAWHRWLVAQKYNDSRKRL